MPGTSNQVLVVCEHDGDGGIVHCPWSLSCAAELSIDLGTETRRINSCSGVVSVSSCPPMSR